MTTTSAAARTTGIGRPDDRTVRLIHTMGTVISIDVRGEPCAALESALDAAEAFLEDADATFSTYREESWISRLARRQVRTRDLPPQVTEVFELCAELEALTDGWFTARWRGDGSLDPTGVVKGWAAEHASRLLEARGWTDHCVNAAGDVAVAGRPAEGRCWRVGIADPRQDRGLLGVVEAPPGPRFAVATSGPAERGLHIVAPRTGRPAAGILAATVTGPTLALADGMATALVAAGPDAPMLLTGWRAAGWSGCLVLADGDVVDPDGIAGPSPKETGEALHPGGPAGNARATAGVG